MYVPQFLLSQLPEVIPLLFFAEMKFLFIQSQASKPTGPLGAGFLSLIRGRSLSRCSCKPRKGGVTPGSIPKLRTQVRTNQQDPLFKANVARTMAPTKNRVELAANRRMLQNHGHCQYMSPLAPEQEPYNPHATPFKGVCTIRKTPKAAQSGTKPGP